MKKWIKTTACLLVVALCGLTVYLAAAQAGGTEYMGEKKCRKCHIKDYKTWADTKHSKAFANINADQQKDPECLKCHTTAYGSGGFTSLEATPDLTNVQCEQCHGPGGEHVPMMEKLKADEVDPSQYPEDKKIVNTPAGCTKCHNPHWKHPEVEGYKKD